MIKRPAAGLRVAFFHRGISQRVVNSFQSSDVIDAVTLMYGSFARFTAPDVGRYVNSTHALHF